MQAVSQQTLSAQERPDAHCEVVAQAPPCGTGVELGVEVGVVVGVSVGVADGVGVGKQPPWPSGMQQVPLLQVAPVELSQQSLLAEQPLCPFCRQQTAPTQLSVLSQQSAGDVHAKAPVITQQVPLLQVAPVEFSQQSVLAEQPEDPLGMQLPRAPCATNSKAVRTSTATACCCLLAT